MLSVQSFASLTEASGAMGTGACFLGGGTLVMRALNYGAPGIERVIRVTDPALRTIRAESGRVVLGTAVTMADLIASRDAGFLAPVARAVGGPAVRTMATVGGNLFAPHPYGDLTTALLALDGVARMADGREVALDALMAHRDQAGLVHSVSILRPSGDAFRFRKIARTKPKGVSVMCMAAHLTRSAGRLSGVRIAYGAMGPAPLRVGAVERALEGVSLDAHGITGAIAAATEGLTPPDDALASGWYRAQVAPVHLRRLLLGEDR